MTSTPHPTPPRCDCPRCGYDMSGPVARWTTACDLRATCPECGLQFLWGDVMNPTRAAPRWFYEAPRQPALDTLPPTIVRMLLPRRFWSAINLAIALHVPRLVALLISVLVLSHLVVAGASLLAFDAEVRQLRGWTTSVTIPAAAETYWLILIWPYSTHEVLATVKYPTGIPTGNPGAIGTYTAVVSPPGASGPHVAIPFVPFVLMPLTYLLLRQTLRRTRVRAAHLFRIFSYSCLLLIPFIALNAALWPFWRGNSSQAWMRRNAFARAMDSLAGLEEVATLPLLLLVLQLFFLGVWWHAATARYLRLPHAAGVVLAMITITTLVLAVMIATTAAWRIYWPI